MVAIYEPRGMAREYAALACNLYSGCSHGCLYCYAPSCLQRNREVFHREVKARSGIIAALEKDAARYADTTERVLLSFTSDPYQPAEDELRLTRAALEVLVERHIPFQVLTKGGLRAARDFDLFEAGNGWFATTLVFTEEASRVHWEPNAASLQSRVEAIKEAHRRGIRTWVSVEPVIDPRQALALIEQLTPWADGWKVGKLNHHPVAKEVDWFGFAAEVQRLLEGSGGEHLIKESLRPYLPQQQGQLRLAM
jgi:DNA repair photolyase